MTLVSFMISGPDWTTVNTAVDAYLADGPKELASISPFIDTDGNKGVHIVTTG